MPKHSRYLFCLAKTSLRTFSPSLSPPLGLLLSGQVSLFFQTSFTCGGISEFIHPLPHQIQIIKRAAHLEAVYLHLHQHLSRILTTEESSRNNTCHSSINLFCKICYARIFLLCINVLLYELECDEMKRRIHFHLLRVLCDFLSNIFLTIFSNMVSS